MASAGRDGTGARGEGGTPEGGGTLGGGGIRVGGGAAGTLGRIVGRFDVLGLQVQTLFSVCWSRDGGGAGELTVGGGGGGGAGGLMVGGRGSRGDSWWGEGGAGGLMVGEKGEQGDSWWGEGGAGGLMVGGRGSRGTHGGGSRGTHGGGRRGWLLSATSFSSSSSSCSLQYFWSSDVGLVNAITMESYLILFGNAKRLLRYSFRSGTLLSVTSLMLLLPRYILLGRSGKMRSLGFMVPASMTNLSSR